MDTDENVVHPEAESRLRATRVYTFRAGNFLCITEGTGDHPELTELGLGRGSSYSLSAGRAPGKDGYGDETEWGMGLGPLTAIARKVANEQAAARKARAAPNAFLPA